MAMLTSTLWTMDPGSQGWRRYLAGVPDGLAPEDAGPLPPPVPVAKGPTAGDWLL
ncbi:hypothetical protein ACFOVU_16890 [Nocardiopsis sediminis]|uniref:Uncharacterized protein n=1 Tax=Nocardiopsis sediminis TaxID=1778267 RepID=A0ABV8FQN0_9ACTN